MKTKRLHALAAAAAVACSFAGCEGGTGSTTESGVVAGRLLGPGGAPLAGAKVSLLPVDHVPSPVLRKISAPRGAAASAAEAVTDADGRYRLSGIAPGSYALSGARDSLAYYRDSLPVPAAGLDAGEGTALPSGSLHGRLQLEPGDEVRTVLILVLGTNILALPRDATGAFELAALAEGTYRVRFLSTLSAYPPLDTVLSIRSGRTDTLASPVRLRSGGIPTVTGLTAVWDADAQAVDLAWDPADPARAAGYYVYRALEGDLMGAQPLNPVPVALPAWRDTTADAGKRYVYAVKAVDRNGNAGAVLSPAALAATDPAYYLSRTIAPDYSPDPSPLAVSGGEIFWLGARGIDVYDTAGWIVRSFGGAGPDSLISPVAIRVFGDTVYVADTRSPEPGHWKEDSTVLRRFSRTGTPMPSLEMGGARTAGIGSYFDFHRSPAGTLYLTDGYSIWSRAPDGTLQSAESPLGPELRNLFAKLEPAAGGMILMGSLRNLTTGVSRTQSAVVDYGLRAGPVDSMPVFLNAYAGDPSGSLWMVRDDSIAEFRSPAGGVAKRIRLPKSLYRDVQEESGVLYLYDYEAQAIRIWRRK